MPTEKELEVIAVRKVADDFRALILQKQMDFDNMFTDYVPEDLVVGTPYEVGVQIEDDKITYTTLNDTYIWVYTPRVGNIPAILTEIQGFDKGA